MKRRYYGIVFFVILALGVSLAVPAEDLPETAFDESETPPYDTTPSFFQVYGSNCLLVRLRLTRISRLPVGSVPKLTERCTERTTLLVAATGNSCIIVNHSLRC